MVPQVCTSILRHIGSSFVFDRSQGEILNEDVFKIVAKLMNTMVLLPSMQWLLNESLLKLLSTFQEPEYFSEFDQNFMQFLAEIYNQFFINNEIIDPSSEHHSHKLTVSYDFIHYILSFIQSTADKIKEMPGNKSKIMQIPQVFYSILYWPLSLSLAKSEVNFSTTIHLHFYHIFFCKTCNLISLMLFCIFFFFKFSSMFTQKHC